MQFQLGPTLGHVFGSSVWAICLGHALRQCLKKMADLSFQVQFARGQLPIQPEYTAIPPKVKTCI